MYFKSHCCYNLSITSFAEYSVHRNHSTGYTIATKENEFFLFQQLKWSAHKIWTLTWLHFLWVDSFEVLRLHFLKFWDISYFKLGALSLLKFFWIKLISNVYHSNLYKKQPYYNKDFGWKQCYKYQYPEWSTEKH